MSHELENFCKKTDAELKQLLISEIANFKDKTGNKKETSENVQRSQNGTGCGG